MLVGGMSSKRDSTTRLDIGLKGLNSAFEKERETIAGEAAQEIIKKMCGAGQLLFALAGAVYITSTQSDTSWRRVEIPEYVRLDQTRLDLGRYMCRLGSATRDSSR